MARSSISPTGKEVFFDPDDVIVSKTDAKGKLVYANDVFLSIAGYREGEVLGQPHNMIRHPDMPRSVFAVLWETIQSGREIFAYVKNMTKSGDHYWVLAHVTPSRDAAGSIVGFHSNRRVPSRSAIEQVEPLYGEMRRAEIAAAGPREAIAAGKEVLQRALDAAGKSYAAFIFSI
ncbi:PAS domain-containing protein [Desertibaculum subflavum]|uniref:PAS domain-containing protein n=1 Tax=Desertibaculum subflavum TaxID=2268458 RepID=UPI000E664B62